MVENDTDIPAGQVGVVIGPRDGCKDEGDLHVRFPNGQCSFKPEELQKMDTEVGGDSNDTGQHRPVNKEEETNIPK